MTAKFRIRAACPDDFLILQQIELAAAKLFAGYDIAQSVLEDSTSLADFQAAEGEGLLWVAVTGDDSPIGFAFVELVEEYAHLDELDVDPQYGRQGVGTALVRTVCDWAVERRLRGVTLTTFRDVPWNAPFYRRLGFVELSSEEQCPALREIVREEAERGLDPARRAVMRWRAQPRPKP